MRKKILIAGFGNLGRIYANKFKNTNEVWVLAKDETHANAIKKDNDYEILYPNDQKEIFDYIIISVKPQDFYSVTDAIRFTLNPKTIVISIMAGIEIQLLHSTLSHIKIVRAMPNAGTKYACGMTGIFITNNIKKQEELEIISLLSSTGKVLTFNNEDKLNAITALSGSGPAYFFYLSKQMTKAAIQLGFDADTANELVLQTFLGAYKLYADSGLNAEQLISVVASKKGTTEAALNFFDTHDTGENIVTGILMAEKRAKELGELTNVIQK